MAINDKLTERVRKMFTEIKGVKEKKMFRGITFMVNGKMCVSVGDDEIMCRIDPALHDELVKRKGVRTMEMGGRAYIGYIFVKEDVVKSAKDLKYWIQLALDFNKHAKELKKKKKL